MGRVPTKSGGLLSIAFDSLAMGASLKSSLVKVIAFVRLQAPEIIHNDYRPETMDKAITFSKKSDVYAFSVRSLYANVPVNIGQDLSATSLVSLALCCRAL